MNANKITKDDVELMERAFEVIRDEKNWTQGTAARNANGYQVLFDDDKAVSWCTYGALHKAGMPRAWDTHACERILQDLARKKGFAGYVDINDDQATTHATIIAFWQEAITIAKAQLSS